MKAAICEKGDQEQLEQASERLTLGKSPDY
jgi:hypothetical protein